MEAGLKLLTLVGCISRPLLGYRSVVESHWNNKMKTSIRLCVKNVWNTKDLRFILLTKCHGTAKILP